MKSVKKNTTRLLWIPVLLLVITSCKKDDNGDNTQPTNQATVTIENVLQAKSLSQSGTFKGGGDPPVILPGGKVSFSFSAAKGQTLTFATMYGWSNDLFFAPANPGIALFDSNGEPITGDVSTQIKLWDNGTRINQKPGANVTHPGAVESEVVTEVKGTDRNGNMYVEASKLMKVTIKHDGNSVFTCTIENVSGTTGNATPFSPGVWTVSNILGGNPLNAMPFYESGKAANTNGITPLAETGDNSKLAAYATENTGIFTPLSPVLIVVYSGENPLFKTGEADRGKGLADIAQKGDTKALEAVLKTMTGVKHVYVAAAAQTQVLLPALKGGTAGTISQKIDYATGDKITFATMFGYSNDWFFSFGNNGLDASATGNQSDKVQLYDNGTAINQFPGAGKNQAALGGTPEAEQSNKPINEVDDDTYPVPDEDDIIRVTIERAG
ncbi:MAG: spondin domain-containing protein [Agriterribacter sp.]